MKEATKEKVISEHMSELARKSHAAIKRDPESLERSRARMAKAREALRLKPSTPEALERARARAAKAREARARKAAERKAAEAGKN